MKRTLSPYPAIASPLPYRPESEAPPPLDRRDTDSDELTPTDTPESIWQAIRGIRSDMSEMRQSMVRLAEEQIRHESIERTHRLVTHAMPVTIWLVSLTAIALAFGAVWIAAQTWREVSQTRGKSTVVVLERQATAGGVVYQ